jgi:hypothetical protein
MTEQEYAFRGGTAYVGKVALAFLCLAVTVNAGDPTNLTGAWRINVDRSAWGSRSKPVSIDLDIQHNESALTYSGIVIYSGEDARPFSSSGAVDGKRFEMNRSFGVGSVILRRIDAATLESIVSTHDGRWIESTLTSVTSDGKRLTRSMRLQSGDIILTSTEVYDRM